VSGGIYLVQGDGDLVEIGTGGCRARAAVGACGRLLSWVSAPRPHGCCTHSRFEYSKLRRSVFVATRAHRGRVLLLALLSDQSFQPQLPLPFAQLFQGLALQLARPFARDSQAFPDGRQALGIPI
jgi:hypothetical protein